MSRITPRLVLFGFLALVESPVWGQAVGFQPVVGSFPSGVTMSATPVVSSDRRYVRLTVNPLFNALEGFDSYPVPAAVGGGPGGPGALPRGGLMAVAGLDGVGFGVGSGTTAYRSPAQPSGFSAGDMPAMGLPAGVYPQTFPSPTQPGAIPAHAPRRKKGRAARPERAISPAQRPTSRR